MSFRHEARLSLDRAKKELASGEDSRVRYAALELRLAMEAITYDRASAYGDDLPKDWYETWQPRKLMDVLLKIDPDADKESTIAVGLEDEPGVPAKEMSYLGSDKPLTLAELKRHYDALGSYLHTPNLKQQNRGPIDMTKLRARCELITGIIEGVLSSTIFNAVFGNICEFSCLRCEAKIRRRLPFKSEERKEIECFECGAGYKIKDIGNAQIAAEPIQVDAQCTNEDCKQDFVVWSDQIRIGVVLRCPTCDHTSRVGYALIPESGSGVED